MFCISLKKTNVCRVANGRVRTILDLDSDPFLNNGFTFGSDSNSESILLVSDPVSIGGP